MVVVVALLLIIPKKTATTGGGGGTVTSSTVISYVDTRDQYEKHHEEAPRHNYKFTKDKRHCLCVFAVAVDDGGVCSR